MNEKDCLCQKCIKCLEKRAKDASKEPPKSLFIKTKQAITGGTRG
jgi:hypothetical protein